jgi:hypothetical protein
MKTSQLMLYSEIIAVFFSDPHKTHKYTGQNAELVNVKLAVQEMPVGLHWVEVKSDWRKSRCA